MGDGDLVSAVVPTEEDRWDDSTAVVDEHLGVFPFFLLSFHFHLMLPFTLRNLSCPPSMHRLHFTSFLLA